VERATGPCRFAGRPTSPEARGNQPRNLRAHAMGARAAPMAGIGGERFSGKPSDWPDTKTEIIEWLEMSGYSYIHKTGTTLFHFAGSGDHNHIDD